MRLPNGNRAVIDARKLTDYSLSFDHDDGRHKAKLFDELLGISSRNAGILVQALREAAESREAAPGRLDRYGQRYIVDSPLAGPAGHATIRSVWIVRTGESVPRLVTCYIL